MAWNGSLRAQAEHVKAYGEYQKRRWARIMSLRRLPWAEYLKSEHWRDRRDQAVREVRCKCEDCGVEGVKFYVSHRNYRNIGCEKKCDLRVLCGDCQRKRFRRGTLLDKKNREKSRRRRKRKNKPARNRV